MKRIRIAALLALSMATLGASISPAMAAAPQPSFAADLSDDGACAFTVVATWKGTKVATVFARFFVDGSFVATMQAPFTAGNPNAGTLKGRTATFNTGAFYPTVESHGWWVLVNFYEGANGTGANLAQLQTNTVTVTCSVPPP